MVPLILDFDRYENLEIYPVEFSSSEYIIKKSRPHKKSRFVILFILKGYNSLHFKRVSLSLRLLEIFLRFQTEWGSAEDRKESRSSTPQEAPSEEDEHLPILG